MRDRPFWKIEYEEEFLICETEDFVGGDETEVGDFLGLWERRSVPFDMLFGLVQEI